MGLLPSNFHSAGSGSYPDPDQKIGLAHLWEIITHDILGLMGAGLLAVLSCMVYIVGMIVSIDSHALLPMFVTCPLGGMLAAPQLCGVADTILRALRDESDHWWASYRRVWKQNAKAALLPGAVGGLLFGFQLFIFSHIDLVTVNLFLLFTMVVGVIVAVSIATWFLPQLVLMTLPPHRVLMNAILMCVRYPLRTLGAVLLQLVYWVYIVIDFPYSSLLFLLLNFWLPMLIAMMILYTPLDDTFHIEEEIDARNESQEANTPNGDNP